MKTIVCAGRVLGVFQNVETLPDALLADGTLLPLAALGAFEIVDGAPPSIDSTWDGQAWIAPPAPPPTVPQSVTRRQARSALLLAGKLSLVQPAIDAITDATQRGLMQIEFDDSQSFDRQRPALLAMAAALGMSSADLDQLFILAATL